MFSFFKYIGIAILSIFTTITGSAHSQPITVIPIPVVQQEATQIQIPATNTPPIKEQKKTITVISPSSSLISKPIINPVATTVTTTQSTFAVTFPTANTVLNRGNSYNVTWNGSDSGVTMYSIFLAGGANGNTSSVNLGEVLASDRYFSWSIPETTVPTDGYYLKFVSGNIIHSSPSFTITSNLPTVTLLTQNQNSNVPVDILVNGGTYYLTGKSFTTVDSVYLANSSNSNIPLSFSIIDDNDIQISMPCAASIFVGQYSLYVASTKEGASKPTTVTVGISGQPVCNATSTTTAQIINSSSPTPTTPINGHA
jgi:Kre9/KNH-like N-terminal Ig-like domain